VSWHGLVTAALAVLVLVVVLARLLGGGDIPALALQLLASLAHRH
jgi:hypothetical protein